nr:MAG TPA: hypothetical protein [Caudoviricetes sp.]
MPLNIPRGGIFKLEDLYCFRLYNIVDNLVNNLSKIPTIFTKCIDVWHYLCYTKDSQEGSGANELQGATAQHSD